MFYEEIIGEFCVLFFPFVLLLIFKFLTKGGLNSDLHFRYVVSFQLCKLQEFNSYIFCTQRSLMAIRLIL